MLGEPEVASVAAPRQRLGPPQPDPHRFEHHAVEVTEVRAEFAGPLGVEELGNAARGHVDPELESLPITVDALEHPVPRVAAGLRPAGGPLQLLLTHPAEAVSLQQRTGGFRNALDLRPDHDANQLAGILQAAIVPDHDSIDRKGVRTKPKVA